MGRDLVKKKTVDYIESLRQDLCDISFELYSYPEVAYQEVRACKLLKDYLTKNDFLIEHSVGGIETAFRASFPKRSKGPKIAFIAEYDALPGIGHGCGHNLIAAGAVGAAIGVARTLKESNITGQIEVIGTPAEEYTEGKAGKVLLLESGVFDTLDVCLMFHPWTENAVIVNDMAFTVMDVTFSGQAAHAAADPWNGRNALDGVVMTYNGLSVLRQQIRTDARIHIIIIEGGSAVNVIPEKAKARIMLRSQDMSYLNELDQRIARCIEGASIASETKVATLKLTTIYNTNFNDLLFEIVSRNSKFFGIELKKPDHMYASSDFGNVTHHIPALSFMMETHKPNIPWHSSIVRDASISEEANNGMITAAKILSMSAIDVMTKPELVKGIKTEFTETKNF